MRRGAGVWAVAASVAAVLGAGAEVSAQAWSVEARGGELRYDGGPGLDASSAFLALAYRAPEGVFRVSTGVPLRQEDPFWAGVEGWRRLGIDVGAVGVGVDLRGNVVGQRDRAGQSFGGGLIGDLPPGRPVPEEPLDGWATTGELMPLVTLGGNRMGGEIRAGAAGYASEFAGETFDRWVWQADGRLHVSPTPVSVLAVMGRHLIAEEADYTFAGITGAMITGPLTLRATAGTWTGEIDGVQWGASAALALNDRFALDASVRHDLVDPLFLTPERTSWGIGFTLALSRPPSPSPPVPVTYREGRATIELSADAAEDHVDAGRRLRIAGDFTGWEPVAMERVDGRWRYTVRVEPGVYNYSFVSPDGTWFVPESVPGRKKDGFGGYVAVLVVEGS